VNVEDLIPPTLSCPADQTVNNGTDCNYQITDFTVLVTVSDNCGVPVLTQNPAVGTAIGTGTHTVEFSAEDASGNISTCSFVLTVSESVGPTITCPADTVSCTPIVAYAAPIIVENCTNYTLTQNDASGFTSGDAFPAGITNQSYLVSDASGNLASCSFNVEILENPGTAEIITVPDVFCEQTSTLLEATPPTNGTGEWSVIEGGASLNNEFANTTGANGLTYGSNTFMWTVSTPSCGSLSDTVVFDVFANPSQANTQEELTLCNDTLINIAATSPSIGIGSWSSVNGTASFLNDMSPNTILYDLEEGWNEIIWTVSNGNCPSTFDTLLVFKKMNAQIYSPDTTVCLLTEGFQLNGSPIASGVSGIWYVISGSAEFVNQASSSPTVTDLSGGNNIIVYGQNHPVCGATTDTVIVIGEECKEFNPIIPTVITPNLDGRNDLFVIANLNVLYPNAEVKIVNRWGNLVFESTGYEYPWDGTLRNEGEELPMGTYFYRILLNDSTDKEITGPISIIR
jgi:gliding motility-associated-like protein